jgi:hypothetical protein
MRASWIARFVASPSSSGPRERVVVRRRVSAASACLTIVDRVAVLGMHHHERVAATSIVRKSVSSSTMSAPL